MCLGCNMICCDVCFDILVDLVHAVYYSQNGYIVDSLSLDERKLVKLGYLENILLLDLELG